MSADQITPERIARFEEFIQKHSESGTLHVALMEALKAKTIASAEVQRLTEDVEQARIELEDERERVNVQREDIRTLRLEVQRLTEEARRSDAGRVEVPDLPGHIWASAHDADSRDQCISEVRDWYRDWIFSHRSRLSPSPQPATGAVVIRDPDDDDWDAFGFQQGTKAEVLRVWNRALATCKNSLQVPQPSADVVVVLDRVAACARDFQDRQRNLTVSRDSWGFFQSDSALESALKSLDALRSSTNHDAQDAGEG